MWIQTMCFSNIIVIRTSNEIGDISQPNTGVYKDIEVPKRQAYTYSWYELQAIRETLLKNRNWKQIDYDTCKTVCSLRLNRRGCRAGKNKIKSRPNYENLISIVTRRVMEQKNWHCQ